MGFKLTEAPVFEPVAEGEYNTVVSECEERDSIFDLDKDDPSKGKQREVSFTFVFDEGESFVNSDGETVDLKGQKIFGRTPTTFTNHPDCKLRAWVQEILAYDDLHLDFEFEPIDLVGLPVKVVVVHKPKKNADGSVGKRAQVAAVKRIASAPDAAEVF